MATSALTTIEEAHDGAKAWLEEHWNPDLTVKEWWAILGPSGWGFPHWPSDWYGQDLNVLFLPGVYDAFSEVGALGRPASGGQGLGASTLLTHGSEEQKARWLPALVRGEEHWCQFFSEPGSGSDLASLQTRAVRDGDEFVVNGQKVWNSAAQYADRGFMVARTNPDVPKHRGITYFIIDVDQPGIEIRPLHQMNGNHGFNEVFFTDARVSTNAVIGEVDNGWAVAITTLMFERFGGPRGVGASAGRKSGLLDKRAGDVASGLVQGPGEEFVASGEPTQLAIDMARQLGKDQDPLTRVELMRLFGIAEMNRLSVLRSAAAVRAGNRPGPEGSVRKLVRTQIMRTAREVGLGVLGASGMLVGTGVPGGGAIQQIALSSPSASIAGGTDEIQHNIIGERVLGLPKEPSFDRDIPFRELKVGTQRI